MKDQLALRIKIGDEKAFELLFRKYHLRLCAFANKFLHNPEEAKEVVQNVFIKIWVSRDNIDPSECLAAFIFKIAHNNCLNILRQKKVESKYIELSKCVYLEHHEISPEESLLAHELEVNIKTVLENLPPKCRRVFELNRMEGLKYREIASLLKISVKTVEVHMSKALRILKYELIDYPRIYILLFGCFFL